jgi:hypothetical protein
MGLGWHMSPQWQGEFAPGMVQNTAGNTAAMSGDQAWQAE